MLTFLLWEILRAPKSLNSEDVGEFTGSVEECKELSGGSFNIQWMSAEYCSTERCRTLTMSAVAEVLGTIVEQTGRAAAGSHSLNTAASRTYVLLRGACMFINK